MLLAFRPRSMSSHFRARIEVYGMDANNQQIVMNEKGQWCAWYYDASGQRVLIGCHSTPQAAQYALRIYEQNHRIHGN